VFFGQRCADKTLRDATGRKRRGVVAEEQESGVEGNWAEEKESRDRKKGIATERTNMRRAEAQNKREQDVTMMGDGLCGWDGCGTRTRRFIEIFSFFSLLCSQNRDTDRTEDRKKGGPGGPETSLRRRHHRYLKGIVR